MKNLKILSILFLIFSCNSQKEVIPSSTINYELIREKYAAQEKEYQDHEGNVVSFDEYLEIIREPGNAWTGWAYVENDKRITRLSSPIYEKGRVEYSLFVKEIEKLTNKKFKKKTTFLIEYSYKDDFCSSTSTNIWDEHRVWKRKEFLSPIKSRIEFKYGKLVYLMFFENGITIQNDPSHRKEFFFLDKDNILREMFRNPTRCGSYALVKPNGQLLIRNGEYRPDWMAKHLRKKNWKQFFPENQ